MKKIGWIVLICLVAVLPACSSADRTAFEKNHSLWAAQGIRHYRFHFKIGCNCPWYALMPLTVEVQDGKIVSMVAGNGGDITNYLPMFRRYATIESLFGTVDSAISKRVDKLAVQYDASYGFPASIVIDPSSRIYDDETGYYVTDFEVLP